MIVQYYYKSCKIEKNVERREELEKSVIVHMRWESNIIIKYKFLSISIKHSIRFIDQLGSQAPQLDKASDTNWFYPSSQHFQDENFSTGSRSKRTQLELHFEKNYIRTTCRLTLSLVIKWRDFSMQIQNFSNFLASSAQKLENKIM